MNFNDYFDYVAVFAGLMTFILCIWSLKRPKNFPPGPHGLPILGHIPFLGKNAAETLMEMKEKYGSIMSVQIGREDWVILNDYATMNEALVKQGEKFSGRPNNFVFDLVTKERGLITIDYGPIWKTLQKFGLMTLRGFGVGKIGMEANVIEETPYLIDNLTTENGQSLHMKLTLAVSNIISRIVFGSRFEYDNKRFLHMIEIIQKFHSDTPDAHMLTAMSLAPVLRFFPPFSGTVKRTSDDADIFMGYVRNIIEEHELEFDETDIRDFIDAFICEIRKSEQEDPSFNKHQLAQYIRDLFDAGSGTTSSTLCWAVLCFAHYPQFQDKISEEVERTLGAGGVPSMKYRDEMPYTCAFIQEIMRHRTLVPLSVFHKTNEEAILNGYTIPRNTTVCPNIWAVHYNSEMFENPRKFRPERFIDGDGKFIRSNHVIPFSIGFRRCIGEQLAKMELFIFLTGIVQKLRILPDPQKSLPSFYAGGSSILTYEPPEFDVIFERR